MRSKADVWDSYLTAWRDSGLSQVVDRFGEVCRLGGGPMFAGPKDCQRPHPLRVEERLGGSLLGRTVTVKEPDDATH